MSILPELDIQIGLPLFVVERSPDAAWKLVNNRNVNMYVLGYCIDGEAIYSVAGKKRARVTKGNVLFMKPTDTYSAHSDSEFPWSFYSVGFEISDIQKESLERLSEMPFLFKNSNSSRMSEDFAELARTWNRKGDGYLIKCRSLILDIIYLLLGDEKRSGNCSAHYDKIISAIDMIRVNYATSYTIAELCEKSGLSSSHFRMLFKQYTGLTAIEFQNRVKIDKAKDLILSRSCNVSQAAETVGFCDVYYFSRMFKRLTGCNPSELMQRL